MRYARVAQIDLLEEVKIFVRDYPKHLSYSFFNIVQKMGFLTMFNEIVELVFWGIPLIPTGAMAHLLEKVNIFVTHPGRSPQICTVYHGVTF